MTNIDPTSISESFPYSGDRPWSVEEVAAAQAEAAGGDGGGAKHETAEAYLEADNYPPAAAKSAAPRPSTFLARPQSDTTEQRRPVSGLYRSQGDVQLELRVDVDGIRPMRLASGDFFRRTGGTLSYVGSFVIQSPSITVTQSEVKIEGEGNYTFQTGSPRLCITIPRVSLFMPRGAATAQFMNAGGAPGASYNCQFESEFFRRVEFEQDYVRNVEPFVSYNTGLMLSGGPARVLDVVGSFAEAGVEMLPTGGANEVKIDLAGVDAVWSKSEMHAAMVEHFSRWEDLPGWRVWLLAATRDEGGNRGIMFDQQGAQRQGCAVFHDVIGGNTNDVRRRQLRTYVHELGHCFNLYHSHHKEYMTPPQPNRLDALSWMHYPDYFKSAAGSGDAAYWRAFPFQFDDLEVIHLRHAFRNDIIMGGNPFGAGAAEVDPQKFADPIEDGSGLRLTIDAPLSLAFGEPVVLQLNLESTDTRGKVVNQHLHPNTSYVQVGINKPGGKAVVYRPFIQNCAEPEMINLSPALPSINDSAYIGYGQDGFYFDSPGVYDVRAVYHAPDGSKVFSNTLKVRVRAPVDKTEDEIAELFLGDEQGQLLYLLGSDSRFLTGGNDALDLVIDKHGTHPLAVYAKMVKGVNASRAFKVITDYEVRVRPARNDESEKLLTDVVQSASHPAGAVDPTSDVNLDNVTLLQMMSRLNYVQTEAGDLDKARKTAQLMMTQAQKVPGRVQSFATKQALSQLSSDDGQAGVGGRAAGRSRRKTPGSSKKEARQARR